MDKQFKVIDLTHTLAANIPSWDGTGGFGLEIDTDYKDCVAPNLFRTQKIVSNAGMGTHMDAPAHVIPGGRTIDLLKSDELVVDCIVVDVISKSYDNYLVMPEVIEEFEKAHDQIPAGSFVIFYTGWSKFWETPKKYHNDHKFPGVHSSTADILVTRNVAGVGIDTLSCDRGDAGFPVHHAILGANKYLVENIANANLLPPTGAKILVLPMNIKDATEAPIRLIALV
ncbi:MAG: cyclase family protein [Candidatus Doudnabacteria bacterium]|nr:cyclase family protein [Candidatus Doudnabacteria bacterium]